MRHRRGRGECERRVLKGGERGGKTTNTHPPNSHSRNPSNLAGSFGRTNPPIGIGSKNAANGLAASCDRAMGGFVERSVGL